MKLSELVTKVYNGEIVLPDFQRSFIWEPEDVRELLVSILSGYFIGSMLTINSTKDESLFALRLIEGVEKVNKNVKIQTLVKILLDGQQRTSSLFYALYEVDIPLKGRKSPYKFFIDIDKALNMEWEEAVISISIRDKKFQEINNKSDILPLSLFKNIGDLSKKFKDHSKFEKIIDVANTFMNYEISVIDLPWGTDLNKIVETFERINRTGEPLSIFDLLTAKLYRNGIKLRDLWENTITQYNFAKFVSPEFILKVIALIRGNEPKRRNILELEAKDFERDWERACKTLEKAYSRVVDTKDGYGVLDFKKWMPYSTMLVPLAAMLDFIRTDNRLTTKQNYDKIDCWYWVSVFSNRYDHAVDTTSAADFKNLKEWIIDDKMIPSFIQKFNFNEIDLYVDKQTSAIYRGVISMIVLKGALDFKTGQPPQFAIEKVQDDHIFPKSIFREDCILNRTLISTNAEKSDKKPSEYFKEKVIERGEEKLNSILESHLIPANALKDLLNDDIEKFFEKRRQGIIEFLKNKVKL